MIKTEIIEGIRRGILRGETLREVMMSFYNAGYSKEEIEEAARAWQTEQMQARMPILQPQTKQPIQKTIQELVVQKQTLSPQSVQKISNYEQKRTLISKKSIIITAILVLILLLLIGALVATFFFRQQIIDFFQSSFG